MVSREARSQTVFILTMTARRGNRITPLIGIEKNLGQKIILAVFLKK